MDLMWIINHINSSVLAAMVQKGWKHVENL